MKVFSFIGFFSVITRAEWSHSSYWDGCWWLGGGEGGGEFQNVLESVVERGLIGKRDSGGGMVGGVVGREDSEIGH